jgi:hypothetical protein
MSGTTRRDYDDAGRYIGRAETQGDTLRQYDDRGRYQGRIEKK